MSDLWQDAGCQNLRSTGEFGRVILPAGVAFMPIDVLILLLYTLGGTIMTGVVVLANRSLGKLDVLLNLTSADRIGFRVLEYLNSSD